MGFLPFWFELLPLDVRGITPEGMDLERVLFARDSMMDQERLRVVKTGKRVDCRQLLGQKVASMN